VSKEHGCPEPLVWSIALEGKSDQSRFKALNWGLRTWDVWNWNDCLPREIHVNDSEAYFTGVTSGLGMNGLPAIASSGESDGWQAATQKSESGKREASGRTG